MHRISYQRTSAVLLTAAAVLAPHSAHAFTLTGSGHYTLIGESLTRPGFQKNRGEYQAIAQRFKLLMEARSNDQLSFFMDVGIFDNPRDAHLGETSRPADCAPIVNTDAQTTYTGNQGNAANCENRHQDSTDPRYKPYEPKVRQAYVQYAFDYCLLQAGRRSRDWGMGIYLNSGKNDLFATDASVFDGVSCDVNVQKSQALGFSFGFDKLQESGPSIEERPGETSRYGSTRSEDDLDQFFFTIQYDDRKANAGSNFTQQVGFYFANILGSKNAKTDIKIADLYASFYLRQFVIKQELLFRLGKSADPTWARYGGVRSHDDTVTTNDVQAIAAAGSIEYSLSRSGSLLGPADFNQGTLSAHKLFFDYAYAPGDSDGYFPELDPNGATKDDQRPRKNNAKAVAFHRNYKPALILFNDIYQTDDLRVDGVFDPGRVMDATVYGGGYRFESLEYGNFEAKLLTAFLNVGIPAAAKARYASAPVRPIGYSGKNLGTELDLKYDRSFGKDVVVGAAAAVALPGIAWRIYPDKKPEMNFLLQSHVGFRF